MDVQDTVNQREWDSPANWTGWLGAYSSRLDTRLWVLKRFGIGQALNLGLQAPKSLSRGCASSRSPCLPG